MLSYKESQTGQPLLDYYNETDLDTIDDQPVDYSKKYADQDSEETCATGKRHLSITESIDSTKNPYDELKVYCIEGTPLIISSASSMSDLRDIGPSRESEGFKLIEEKVPTFQTIKEVPTDEDCAKVDEKSEDCELDNPCDENLAAENTNRTNEESFSKVSSPLMFSRSSSVCSLNSFEIASIRDDRSSVSAFSTLTSGLISPSDIPDSPGEAMSPFIHQRNKFSFPSNEKSMDPILGNPKDNASDQFEKVFDDVQEDNMIIYDEEGDFSSVSNFSALTHHTTHTSSSRVSFTVFNSENLLNINHVSRVKIKYSMKSPEESVSETCDTNNVIAFDQELSPSNHNQCEDSLPDFTNSVDVQMENLTEVQDPVPILNVSMEDKEEKMDEYSKEDSDEEALLEECIKSGMPSARTSENLNKEPQSELTPKVKKTFSEKLSEVEPLYSDEESDNLLNQCILLGKPESKNTSMDISKSPDVSPAHSSVNSRVQENSPVQNCVDVYCENDASDDENDLLADCILLGKPQSVAFASNKNVNDEPPKQTQTKAFCENDASDDDLLEDCIQLGRKSNYTTSQNLNPKALTSNSNCVSQSSRNQPAKSNVSTYQQTYSDPLNKPLQNFKKPRANPVPNVAQCLPMGYPKGTIKNSYNKETFASSTSRSFSPMGYRDNIPDGTSDVEEDDDDDLVTECIRAGKMNSKVPEVKQYSPSSSTLKQLPMKSVQQMKPAPKDDRSVPSRKANSLSQRRLFDSEYFRTGCVSPSSLVEIDSMCVYRTEDTPLLSPTASISDLSTLSFSEDKVGHGYYLNNSRNSVSSSESEDDEILLQCIQSGMPENRRAVA